MASPVAPQAKKWSPAVVAATLAAAVGVIVGFVSLQRWRAEQLAHKAEEARYARAAPRPAPAVQPSYPELPPLPPAISAEERAEILAAAQFRPPEGTTGEYSWPQIDRILAAVRSQREKRPQATDELMAWYDHLSAPAFTLSLDLEDHLQKLEAWSVAVPDSPTPLIVIGRAHIRHSWQARGWGYADTVNDENARIFKERLEEAQEVLQRAVALGLHDGEAIAAQIMVAKGLGLSKPYVRDLLAQGIKLDPSYSRMYMSMAEYFLPRWHGAPGEVERQANEVASELGGEEGLDAFGQMAFIVNHYDLNTLFDGEYDRRLLSGAAELLVRRYAYDANYVAFAALCAYAAQDHAKARWVETFLPADEQITRVPYWDYHARTFRKWCAARSVPNDETSFVWTGPGAYGNIAFDADSQGIWTGNGGSDFPLKLLSATTGRRELALKGPRGSIYDLSVNGARTRLAAIIMNEKIKYWWVLWNRETPQEPLVTPVEGQARAIALNPASDQLALGLAQSVQLLDLPSLEVTSEIKLDVARHEYVHFLKYSQDGTRLGVNTKIYDTSTGQQLLDLSQTMKDKPLRIVVQNLIGFDAENRPLATAQEAKANPAHPLVRFNRADSWEAVIPDLGKHSLPAALSPDCRFLAIAGEFRPTRPEGIAIWDLVQGKKMKQLGGHWQLMSHLTFSPDGKQLASVEQGGGVVKLWSMEGLLDTENASAVSP